MYRVQLSKLFSFLMVESVSGVAQVTTSTFTTSFPALKGGTSYSAENVQIPSAKLKLSKLS